jgi:hypothetical protein
MLPIHDADITVDSEFEIVPPVVAEDVLGDALGLNRDYVPLVDTTWSEADTTTTWECEVLERLAEGASDAAMFEELAGKIEEEDYEAAATVDERLYGLDLGVAGLTMSLAAVGLVPFYSCRGHADYAIDRTPQVGLFGDEPRLRVLATLAESTGCGLSSQRSGVWLLARSISDLNMLARAVLDAVDEFDRCGPPPWRAGVDALLAQVGNEYDGT